MDIFRQHEIFEIEVLERMKNSRALDPLVFGGGSMLRLCHELPRYSVGLDFWFVRSVSQEAYFEKLFNVLKRIFEITDAQIKHFTLLFELRYREYSRRLKIEIRRGIEACDFQEMIAFSRFATRQVALKAHTLDQTMRNKVSAFLDRGEIKDCFDIEFLLRRGIDLPQEAMEKIEVLLKKVDGFTEKDFKVKLGSIVEAEFRDYYAANRFGFLKEKLTAMLS
jgi:hypothetical protein